MNLKKGLIPGDYIALGILVLAAGAALYQAELGAGIKLAILTASLSGAALVLPPLLRASDWLGEKYGRDAAVGAGDMELSGFQDEDDHHHHKRNPLCPGYPFYTIDRTCIYISGPDYD